MPDYAATSETHVRSHPGAVADARGLLRRLCSRAGTGPEAVERAELALSEVMTNALTHGRAPIDLRMVVDAEHVKVAVIDGGTAPLRLRAPADDDPHGRGLAIVAAVATAWGWERQATGGRIVWFTVREPARGGPVGVRSCA